MRKTKKRGRMGREKIMRKGSKNSKSNEDKNMSRRRTAEKWIRKIRIIMRNRNSVGGGNSSLMF